MIPKSYSAHALSPTTSQNLENATNCAQFNGSEGRRSKPQILARSHSLSTKPDYDNLRQSDTCSICLETISIKSENRTTPCLHRFHRTCINSWTETFHHTTCPNCKTKIETDVRKEDKAVRYFQFDTISTLSDLEALHNWSTEVSSPFTHLSESLNNMSDEEIDYFFMLTWNSVLLFLAVSAGLIYYFDQ